jgi:transcriptional regulator with XRE-family HTH domain
MESKIKGAKIAVLLRAARAAVGWNQQHFAERMEVAKSTVARIETLDMAPRADFFLKALELFEENGVRVEIGKSDKIIIEISELCFINTLADLADTSKRRSDRHSPLSQVDANTKG